MADLPQKELPESPDAPPDSVAPPKDVPESPESPDPADAAPPSDDDDDFGASPDEVTMVQDPTGTNVLLDWNDGEEGVPELTTDHIEHVGYQKAMKNAATIVVVDTESAGEDAMRQAAVVMKNDSMHGKTYGETHFMQPVGEKHTVFYFRSRPYKGKLAWTTFFGEELAKRLFDASPRGRFELPTTTRF